MHLQSYKIFLRYFSFLCKTYFSPPHHLLHLIIYTTKHKWWGNICFYHICGMRNAAFVLLWVCKKVRIFAMSIIKERNIIYKRLRRGTGDDKRCIALVA